MTPITDWGTALVTSATAALMLFLEAIPKIIGFLVILLIGWLIASALAGVVAALLRAARFNDLARRSGLADLLDPGEKKYEGRLRSSTTPRSWTATASVGYRWLPRQPKFYGSYE